MQQTGIDLPLHTVSTPIGGGTLRVLGSGDRAFQEIVDRVRSAERSVEIRAFLWRDDEAGNQMGEAVLAAADRGAEVTIHKDKIAAVYEYTGGNKQSFFHKRVDPIRGFQAWFLGAVYRAPGSFKQRPNALSERILEHPNIDVQHHRKRFDHSKVYIVDDRYLILGSMGIGDNHRHEWFDVMVEVEGAEHVARLRERMVGHDEFDPSRGVDFLVHSREAHRKKTCPMISHRLALIDRRGSHSPSRWRTSAIAGSRRRSRAPCSAASTSSWSPRSRPTCSANINRATCDTLMRLTGAPENLTIVLLPRMVHSKVVVIDHRFGDVGSANFTSLSHGVYDEINLYADTAPFALALEAEIARHCADGRVVDQRLSYRRMYSGLERAIIAYQSRRGG